VIYTENAARKSTAIKQNEEPGLLTWRPFKIHACQITKKKKNEMNEGCNFPKDCVRTKKGDE